MSSLIRKVSCTCSLLQLALASGKVWKGGWNELKERRPEEQHLLINRSTLDQSVGSHIGRVHFPASSPTTMVMMLASQQRAAMSIARPAVARLSVRAAAPKIGLTRPVLAGQPLVSKRMQ